MLYQSGKTGNPRGRPKGCCGGRIRVLAGLDRLLVRKKNLQKMLDALEKDMQGDPVRFFKTVVMPLLPKEARLSVDRDGVIQWRSLIGGGDEDAGQVSKSVAVTEVDEG